MTGNNAPKYNPPAMLRRPGEWYEQGACRKADETLFFHPENERGSTRVRRVREAKKICDTCPVKAPCLAYAHEVAEPFGVWGGEGEDARKAILAGKPVPTPKVRKPKPEPLPKPVPEPRMVRNCPDVPPSTQRHRVNDERVTRHVQALVEAGYGINEIAETAGVVRDTVRALASGSTRVTQRTVTLLLAVRPVEQTGVMAA